MKKTDRPHVPNSLDRFWRWLVGSRKEFTQVNRTVSAISIISMLVLLISTINNIALSLTTPALFNIAIILALVPVYVLSRVYKRYKIAFGIYAICSYMAVISTYIYNGGIDGPSLIFFFLTFQLLIAISPKRQHVFWAVKHIIVGLSLMWLEYLSGDIIQVRYTTGVSRYLDMGFSYALSLLFVYIVTINLRKNYEREKNIAQRRAQQVAARSAKIGEQNKRLQEIAWMQSHKVRAHAATILGLADLMNTADMNDPVNLKVLNGIKQASEELDQAIYDMNEIAKPTDNTGK